MTQANKEHFKQPAEDDPPAYNPEMSGEYNPSAGAGYQPSPSAESTTAPATRRGLGDKGAQIGGSIQGIFAGIHGAGEVLRGGFNAAVDRAFGHEAAAQKNEAIAREGEREMQSGKFGSGTR